MKSEVKTPTRAKEKDFPKLMISKNGTVVLFSKSCVGIAVNTTSNYDIGYLSEEWFMGNFTDFTGTVTLSND